MEQVVASRPWERLRELLAAGDTSALVAYLETLSSDDTVRAIFRLSPEEQSRLVAALPPEEAAELIDEVPEAYAADLLEELAPQDAASIVGQLDSDDIADLLAELDQEDLEEILGHMDPDDADEARRLISYAPDCAGGLMMTEYLAYQGVTKVRDVIRDLSSRTEDFPLYHLQQIYVIGPRGRLRGAVNLQSVAFADPDTPLSVLSQPADAVAVSAGLAELEEFFDTHDQVVAPVVDSGNHLVGVLRRRAVFEAIAERAEADSLKRQGIVGGEELRSMPVLLRSRRRLSWLSVNILLNIIAASVIALYEETLAAAIALAVFLPIVSDMSGCSGNQAVAVSMRELTLGIVRPADLLRVWLKEASVGLLNGLALGLLIAAAAWVWKGNPWLGLVVGAALALNTLIAVSIGGTVPLLLKGIRIDPALASGPVLTTITDMCGFFLVLSLATLMLPLIG